MSLELFKIFASLGVPGLSLGVMYFLFRKYHWKIPVVPRKWAGPLALAHMIIVGLLVFYGLNQWAPRNVDSIQDERVDIDADLIRKASTGDAAFQYLLASSYENGLRGFKKDYDLAQFWYAESASNDYGPALDKIKNSKPHE